MSTYGIFRGFLYVEPGSVPAEMNFMPPGSTAWSISRPITLEEITRKGRFDFM